MLIIHPEGKAKSGHYSHILRAQSMDVCGDRRRVDLIMRPNYIKQLADISNKLSNTSGMDDEVWPFVSEHSELSIALAAVRDMFCWCI